MAVGFAVLSFLAISFLLVCFTLLFCGIVLLYDLRKKYGHIPGPKIDHFIWGNSKEFKEKARYLVFEDLVQKHGPVIVTWNVHKPVVTIADPSIIDGVLGVTEFKDCLCNGDFSALFEQRFLGSRTQFLYGFQPDFDKTFVKRHLKSFNICCDMFLKNLETLSDGKADVKMAEQFEKLAVDVVAKVAFGINLNCTQDPSTPFYKALQECQQAISWSKSHALHKWDITSYEYQNVVVEAVKYLRDFGKKIIDRRRTDVENGEAVDDDYLTSILMAASNDAVITLDDMLDEFVLVCISGQSQLTSLLSNILFELLQHPSIEEKVYEEVLNVVSNNSPVTFEDLDKLKFISCVVKETVRLHPPVSSVQAQLTEPAKLQNHLVPKNTSIQMIPYVSQTNPQVWEEPKDFRPDRFLESDDVAVNEEFPYAMRKHVYLNGTFAECLVKVVFPSLLNKFKFGFRAGQDVKPTRDLITVPKDGIVCTLMQI